MSKVAILTDTHNGARNDEAGIRRQQSKFYNFFFDYLKANGITRVLHAGDLYDRRKYINFQTQQFTRKEFLERFEQEGIELHIIPGNHDQYSRNTNAVLGLEELARGFKNVTVLTDPTELEIYGKKILMLPWICDQNMQQTLDMIQKTEAKYCLAHLELYGFEMDKGNVCTHGMDAETFAKFHWVGTGHFHHRSSKGNIHYLGATGELTWHDYNDARGFTIMDFSNGQWFHVDNPFKVHHVVEYDDSQNQNLIEADYSHLTDGYVKVKIIRKTNDYMFDLFMEKLEGAKPIKVTILESLEIDSFMANDAVAMNEVESTPALINLYVDNLKLEAKSDKLKGLMSELYNEALSLETID